METSWETLKPQIDAAYAQNDYATTLRLMTPLLGNTPAPLANNRAHLRYYLFIAGYSAQKCNEFDLALRFHQECVAVSRTLSEWGDTQYLAEALHFLGDTHIQRRERRLAAPYLKESLQAAKEDASRRGLEDKTTIDLHIVFDVGEMAYARNDRDEARQYLLWSRQLAKDAGDHYFEMRSLQCLVYLETLDGPSELAKAYYEEGLNVAERAPEGVLFFNGHPHLASMAERVKAVEHAYFHYSRSIKLARVSNNLPTLARLSWIWRKCSKGRTVLMRRASLPKRHQ
jgi:hypothetical protein